MTFILLASVLGALCAVMAGAFALQRRTGNSGWIDTIWSFGTGGVIATALVAGTSQNGRGLVIAGLILLWALRLGGHIAHRSAKTPDDARYADLMREWGADAPWRLFRFLQIQALASFVLAISAIAAALNPRPLGWVDLIAVLVASGALWGEAIADRQLRLAKAAGEPMCERGLWAISRHPNYFFEFSFWCALPIFALSGGGSLWPGLLSLLAPLQMYVLLVHVSGIPPLEAHMLRKHGAAFEAYQARVSAFFPLPRLRKSTPSPSGKRVENRA